MNGYENNMGYMNNGAAQNYVCGAKIKVVGVGGAGNNAVNRLIESGLHGAEFIVVNTDLQDLAHSQARTRIQIGAALTKGLGAGADPNTGKKAAEADREAIKECLQDTDLLFIAAGMGGGTGTGAAPVIAEIAKEMEILTVAVVTLPFGFEGNLRMVNALTGVEELKRWVDAIITIPNEKIGKVVKPGTSFKDALKVADEVLRQGIRGIAELILKDSLINLDFADIRTTLKGRGLAHMGIGAASGEKRIYEAVRCAVSSPLMNTTIEGAKAIIINVIGGNDLGLDEVSIAANLVKDVIDYSANVIFGACIDESMGDEVEIVIIATGFEDKSNAFALDSQNDAMYQSSNLYRKLDYAYNHQNTGSAVPGANEQPTSQIYTSPSDVINRTQMSSLNRVKPISSFEPDDPIPEASSDKKHRPHFVDFFMRKNGENEE